MASAFSWKRVDEIYTLRVGCISRDELDQRGNANCASHADATVALATETIFSGCQRTAWFETGIYGNEFCDSQGTEHEDARDSNLLARIDLKLIDHRNR